MQWSTLTCPPLHIILFCGTPLYTHSCIFHTVLHMFACYTPPYVYILCSIIRLHFVFIPALISVYFFDTYFSLGPSTVPFSSEGSNMYELLLSKFIRRRWLCCSRKLFRYPYLSTETRPNFTQSTLFGRAKFKFN